MTRIHTRRPGAALAALAAAVLALPIASAELRAQLKDPVVVSRGTAELTMSEIDARVHGLPEKDRAGYMNSPKRIEQTLQTLLLDEQLAHEARELGLDSEPFFEEEVALAAKQILARRRMEHFVANLELPDFEQLARERYQANPEKYGQPERLDLVHILVMAKNRTEEQARARAEEVRQLALAGEKSFHELVAEYTDESRARGATDGRLRNTVRGAMVPEFEEVAFALQQPGDISEVVKTPYGYHVIMLEARKPAVQYPFEQVRGALVAELEKNYVDERRNYHTDALRSMPLDADPDLVRSLRTRYLPEGASLPSPGDESSPEGDAAHAVPGGGDGPAAN